jgi:hypothetical protein
MSKQRDVTAEEAMRELEQRVEGADQLRADELGRLAGVRRAREASLKREEARLAKKHAAGHPRRAYIAGRLAANAGFVRDLDLEASRARTDIPKVAPNGWAVHGYVRDKDLKPVAGLTVALYDGRANWVEQFGYACTDSNGYFRIETQEVGAVDGPLYLRVLTGQAAHLYADKSPLTPLGGALEYREIILAEGAQACAPPTTSPRDPVAAPGTWVIRGRVTDAQGRGVGGLTVNLYDKDWFWHDRLGQAETDEDGNYILSYHTEDFRDVFERKPDLFLRVLDANGKTLFSTKRTVRHEAGRVEIINVRLGGGETQG